MTTLTLAGTPTTTADEIDNRAAYISFGLAYVLGHGSNAISAGADPLVALPGWLPMALLGAGLAAGTVFATLAAVRSQRGAGASDLLSGRLLGLSWLSAFAGVFLVITALTGFLGMPELQTVLWPVCSGLIVGLLYLAEGAARRNVLHYALGTWLVLVSTSALFFGTPGLFWVLAIAGGGGYAVASVLEHRRAR
ncbi:ABC transporter permease [Nonomuraea sp. NPDC050404]|uniref:ABC transporter permease n=1 Tax=Nonomuraea sp. NPDC050404 TaxID=3155783 RepID=UPI0033F657CD